MAETKSTSKPEEKKSQIAVEQPKTDAEKLAAMAAMEFADGQAAPQFDKPDITQLAGRAAEEIAPAFGNKTNIGKFLTNLAPDPAFEPGPPTSGFLPGTPTKQPQGPKQPAKAAAPAPTPKPTVNPVVADFSMFAKEQAGSRSDAIRQKLDNLMKAAAQAPPTMQPRPFTKGQRIAAAILAGIDPQRYALLVMPEIERRNQEVRDAASMDDAERQRQIDVARLGIEIEGTLQALDQQEELDSQQRLIEQFVFEGMQESAAAAMREADETIGLVQSEAGRKRMKIARNSVSRMRALFPAGAVTEATTSLFGSSVDYLRGLVQQETQLKDSGLSEKEQDTLRATLTITKALTDVRGLIEGDDFGSGREGGWIGQKYAEVKDFMGSPQSLSQLETIRNFFSTITGTINREMGGGAALSEFEAQLLEGMFLTMNLPKTTKLARIDALLQFMGGKLELLQGNPIDPKTGQRTGPTSNRQTDAALLSTYGKNIDEPDGHDSITGAPIWELDDGSIIIGEGL